MERCVQFNSQPNDLALPHPDQWRFDSNIPIFRAHSDELVERVIIGRSAVRVPRAVLLHGPNQHLLSAQNLRPTHGGGKKVRIAEWNVSYWNFIADLGLVRGSLRHRNSMVGQCRSADSPEQVDPQRQQL